MDETAEQLHREEIRVLIVEDHDLFRQGLSLLLGEHGLMVVGEAANGVEAVDLACNLLPDVVLMDLHLPELSGIDATKQITALAPTTRVLVLTASGGESDVVDALLAGASGYLLKGASAETLVRGIRSTLDGASLLSPGIATGLLRHIRRDSEEASRDASLAEILSERELDVLRLLSAGKQNAAIAEELYVSVHTVRNHISNILAKLQIRNRTEATAFAIRAGIV
jgi:DNA-binding NarL/FixJ family response regulator